MSRNRKGFPIVRFFNVNFSISSRSFKHNLIYIDYDDAQQTFEKLKNKCKLLLVNREDQVERPNHFSFTNFGIEYILTLTEMQVCDTNAVKSAEKVIEDLANIGDIRDWRDGLWSSKVLNKT